MASSVKFCGDSSGMSLNGDFFCDRSVDEGRGKVERVVKRALEVKNHGVKKRLRLAAEDASKESDEGVVEIRGIWGFDARRGIKYFNESLLKEVPAVISSLGELRAEYLALLPAEIAELLVMLEKSVVSFERVEFRARFNHFFYANGLRGENLAVIKPLFIPPSIFERGDSESLWVFEGVEPYSLPWRESVASILAKDFGAVSAGVILFQPDPSYPVLGASIQSFIPGMLKERDGGDIEEFFVSKLGERAVVEIQRMVLASLIVGNQDCYSGNVAVCGKDGDYRAAIFDLAICCPNRCSSNPRYVWMNWQALRKPLQKSLLDIVTVMDWEKKEHWLSFIAGSAKPQFISVAYTYHSMVKQGCLLGLTLYDIASLTMLPCLDKVALVGYFYGLLWDDIIDKIGFDSSNFEMCWDVAKGIVLRAWGSYGDLDIGDVQERVFVIMHDIFPRLSNNIDFKVAVIKMNGKGVDGSFEDLFDDIFVEVKKMALQGMQEEFVEGKSGEFVAMFKSRCDEWMSHLLENFRSAIDSLDRYLMPDKKKKVLAYLGDGGDIWESKSLTIFHIVFIEMVQERGMVFDEGFHRAFEAKIISLL